MELKRPGDAAGDVAGGVQPGPDLHGADPGDVHLEPGGGDLRRGPGAGGVVHGRMGALRAVEDHRRGRRGASRVGRRSRCWSRACSPPTCSWIWLRNFVAVSGEGTAMSKGWRSITSTGRSRKAVDCTVEAVEGDGRAGVVWHTQGSGKSLEMLFYAGKVMRHPAMENPTLVVFTDRNDLDDQLFATRSPPPAPVHRCRRRRCRPRPATQLKEAAGGAAVRRGVLHHHPEVRPHARPSARAGTVVPAAVRPVEHRGDGR